MDDEIGETILLKNDMNANGDLHHKKHSNGDLIDAEDIGREKKKEAEMKMLNEKIQGYVDGFTVHGLTRVITAPRKESAFWFLSLSCGLLMSVIVVYGLVSKYAKHDVYTEIRSIVTDKNLFPSITFCEFNLLRENYFAYCGIPMNKVKDIQTDFMCNYSTIYQPPDAGREEGKTWSNDIFTVTSCLKWDDGPCNYTQVLKSRKELNHSCFTWNYDGQFYDMYSHVTLTFEFNSPSHSKKKPRVLAIPHDSSIQEIDLTKSIDISSGKKSSLNMASTHVKRKHNPFPSACINGGNELDMLPGIYARRTCLESQIYKRMFKICGGTTDYMRPHIEAEFRKKKKDYHKERSFKEMVLCIRNETKFGNILNSECPFPCEELELATFATYGDLSEEHEDKLNDSNSLFFELELQLQSVDSYKVMEEKELYPWDQMACEIGGFLGLVMGASMLSMIEIFACAWYYGLKRFRMREKEKK